LEVLLLTGVRGRGHQQQVPGEPTEETTQLEAFGGLQLRTEVAGAHPVRLVDDDQVPAALLQEPPQILGAGQSVHARYESRMPVEDVAVDRRVGQLSGEQGEVQAELLQ